MTAITGGAAGTAPGAAPAPTYRLPVYKIQMVRERTVSADAKRISRPQDAAPFFAQYFEFADREHLAILMLDAKNRVIGVHTVSVGTLDTALICPREVFKAALLGNAAGIIVAHNHPSGDPEPSPEDLAVTRQLLHAGDLLGVRVLDHLVIGDGGAFVSIALTEGWAAL